MRLYYEQDGDLLWWEDFNGGAVDVTDEPRYRHAAKLRGLSEPEVISTVVETAPGTSIVPLYIAPHTMASAITKSYATWERKAADIYPTPVDGTESIIPLIQAMSEAFEAIHGRPIRRIWEPACGDGRLSRVLEWHGYEVVSTDLREHSGFGIGGLDFLNDDPATKWGLDIGEIDLIVTNPPFSLSVEFVRRALGITPWVIMLVKQNYYNTQNRYGFFQDKRPGMFLPCTWRLAFLEEERGKSPLMDCAWAVWGPPEIYDKDICVFEPLLRRKYPGYGKKGVLAATKILEGEIVLLMEALEKYGVPASA